MEEAVPMSLLKTSSKSLVDLRFDSRVLIWVDKSGFSLGRNLSEPSFYFGIYQRLILRLGGFNLTVKSFALLST